MNTYFLDTNILVGYVRGSSFARFVDQTYSPAAPPNLSYVSIVSKAELYALTYIFNWGAQKKEMLETLLRKFPLADINQGKIIQRYAEIEAYSQNKLPNKPLPVSARNMSDNDKWIAATASVLKATLLTLDRDFDHLNGVYLDVIYIEQNAA